MHRLKIRLLLPATPTFLRFFDLNFYHPERGISVNDILELKMTGIQKFGSQKLYFVAEY